MTPSRDLLKQIILEINEPILFNGIISNDNDNNWNKLELNNFIKLLGDNKLPFRVGKNKATIEPQWDINCPVQLMTINEFMEISDDNNNEDWYYFDYKYMHEWFNDKPEILEAVDWKLFGFEKSGRDSTLWIGSKGAHTNCHQDTYGCNLIAQLHGRKEWLLFPPDSGIQLKQTRIPYEESTIYSKYNFFSPTKNDREALERVNKAAKSVVLKQGQVLFVPKGWWHYVESLDFSVSVNVWLPLESDNEGRLREAVTKFLMSKMENVPASEDLKSVDLKNLSVLMQHCVDECKKLREKSDEIPKKKVKTTPLVLSDLVNEYPDIITAIDDLNKEQLSRIISLKNSRFKREDKINLEVNKSFNDDSDILKTVVDRFCSPDIIDVIVNSLLND
ncbi:GSCOCG00001635001-RA-CDS [Cotesia congregata]|uniref:Similar to HSPBAP1: HSPB1-associated protein 1 (Homo sapiens) n=1 Tax=Cotesia congregata TaxID=51543 RepID=A0A8J2HSI7_COTCN|nr:GSCOCG00001635001-RA-CDS [Cotesia congregata]CAG5106914.1 Similar to HSPBAP1: HSPB1-associated protein 1 (Homo sapiens) [Cotesia congregata]